MMIKVRAKDVAEKFYATWDEQKDFIAYNEEGKPLAVNKVYYDDICWYIDMWRNVEYDRERDEFYVIVDADTYEEFINELYENEALSWEKYEE